MTTDLEIELLHLTFYGFSCFKLETKGKIIYFDPYLKYVHKIDSLAKADLIVFSHGHFDHGALMLKNLYKHWMCPILASGDLVKWMKRKYKRYIPSDNYLIADYNETVNFEGNEITAIPAYHPLNRLGKTIFALHTRSRTPGKPVNGYYINGFYHSGDTKYTSAIAESLAGKIVKAACLPIGGKYAVANPGEAIQIATEIGAPSIIPMHYHPLIQQVPFRYQPSHLVKLVKSQGLNLKILPLAIGETVEIQDP